MKILRQIINIFKESLKGIWRNFAMSLASIISIAAMLTLFGVVFVLILNINGSVYHLGNELDKVIVYLKDKSSAKDVNALIDEIADNEKVRYIEYISQYKALEDFKKGFKENANILDTLPADTLPASLVIELNDLSYAKELKALIKDNGVVERVDYHYEILEKMQTFERGVKYVGSMIVCVLFFVSILIIYKTIKIAVTNRRREIYIMKYVGATRFYIRSPFLLEGIIFGVIGAVVSFFIVNRIYEFYYLKVNTLIMNMFNMNISTPTSIRESILIIFLCIGGGIGYIGSLLSTNRFLEF